MLFGSRRRATLAERIRLGEVGQQAPARLEHDLVHKSWGELWPVVEPMALGSVPIGIVVGGGAYLVVRRAVATYQKARRERLAAHRHAPVAARWRVERLS